MSMNNYSAIDSQRQRPPPVMEMDPHRNDPVKNRFTMSAPTQPVNSMAFGPPALELFCRSGDDPYIPKGLLPHGSYSRSQQLPSPGYVQGPQFSQYQWRNPQPSDCDCPSDSGYASMAGPHMDTSSVCSYPIQDRSNEVRGLISQVSVLNVVQGAGSGLSQEQDIWATMMQQEPNAKGPFRCPFPDCKKPVCKTRSELRKHHQRHMKPYKCQEPNCTRTEGFSTKNDLDRHMKSVHGAKGVRYICNLDGCRDKHKLWPRPDNFKAHLERSHRKTVSIDQLEPYKYCEKPSPPPASHILNQGLVFGSGSNFESTLPDNIPTDIMDGMSQDETQSDEDDLMPEGGDSQYTIDSNFPAACGSSARRTKAAVADLEMDNIDMNSYESQVSGSSHNPLPPAAFLCRQDTGSTMQGNRDWLEVSGTGRNDQQPATTGREESEALKVDCPSRERECQSNMGDSQQHRVSPSDTSTDVIECSSRHSIDEQASSASSTPKEIEISLEDISQDQVQRILERLQGTVMLTETLQKLGYVHAKQSPKHSDEIDSAQTTASVNFLAEGKVHCSFPECTKIFQRRCDLTKHMKRHKKPYGCTFGNCSKKFGSKNDWKRHENTQHFQLEMWKCDFRSPDSPDSEPCGRATRHRETFENHLKDSHNLGECDIERMVDSCRIGRGFEGAFWCGFCKKRVVLPVKGKEGCGQRFNHIDDHFFGRHGPQYDISNWEAIEAGHKSLDTPTGDSDAGESRREQHTLKRSRLDDDPYDTDPDNAPKRIRRERVDQIIKGPYSVVITCCDCGQFQGTERVHDRCPTDNHDLVNCDTCDREVIETHD